MKIKLTEEDIGNIGIWITAASKMAQSGLRGGFTESEQRTWTKIKRIGLMLRVKRE